MFDRLAAKFKGVEKAAKGLENVKMPSWVGDPAKRLEKFGLSDKELADVRRRHQEMYSLIRGQGAANQFRAAGGWWDKELDHWKKLKSGINGAADAHKSWRRTIGAALGSAALRGAAMLGGAYAVARTAKAGIKAAAEGQRESARDYLAGLDDYDSKRLERAALASTHRNMAVDSSTMHERLRDTAMSMRSVDNALELADVIAQGTTVLQSLKGKDKAVEEARKFFSALDVLGKNIDPKEVKELWNGYIKALGVEGADMDLAGVLQFARQSRAAGGLLSNRFLMTSMPGLARDLGDAQLGTSLSSALNQNIGGRATKESMAAQRALGIRTDKGVVQDRLAMSDPDRWAWEVLMPALQKKGIDTNDDLAVTKAMAKIFSNRTVQDVFAKLINQRAQYQGKAEQYARAPGLAAAGPLMSKDPFVAYEALFAQLRTLAGQGAPLMITAAEGLNSLSGAIAGLNQTIATGELPAEARGARAMKAIDAWNERRRDSAGWLERERIGSLRQRLNEAEAKVGWSGLTEQQRAAQRIKAFELRGGIAASESALDMPPIFTEAERKKNEDLQLELMRERNRGRYGDSAGRYVPPLPESDPRKSGAGTLPPVQPLDGANLKVEGDVKGQVEVQLGEIKIDSSGLATFVQRVERALADITGKMRTLSANSNGPGSSGRSSPDAASPGGRGFGGGGL